MRLLPSHSLSVATTLAAIQEALLWQFVCFYQRWADKAKTQTFTKLLKNKWKHSSPKVLFLHKHLKWNVARWSKIALNMNRTFTSSHSRARLQTQQPESVFKAQCDKHYFKLRNVAMQIVWNVSGCVWQCASKLGNVFHLHRNALVHLLRNNTCFVSHGKYWEEKKKQCIINLYFAVFCKQKVWTIKKILISNHLLTPLSQAQTWIQIIYITAMQQWSTLSLRTY